MLGLGMDCFNMKVSQDPQLLYMKELLKCNSPLDTGDITISKVVVL